MEHPHSHEKLKVVKVTVRGTQQEVTSYQCRNCGYFEFEPVSSQKVIRELRGESLNIYD